MDHGPAEAINPALAAEDKRQAGTEHILKIGLVEPDAAHLARIILQVDDK
jgi:hypothetical protein